MQDIDHKERAALMVVKAIYETIEEMGDNGAPLGIMYAALMGRISHDTFMTVIGSLERTNIIEVKNHVAFVKRQP